MSVLSQFFGGGGGGGGIPTEVLLVDGGSGVSCVYCCQGPSALGTIVCRANIQGRGGSISSRFFEILPGSTYPVTVGAGGSSLCRQATRFFNACPYIGAPVSVQCCFGGSGCASKFGNFGGVDRPQPTSTSISPYTPWGVAIPYGAVYPSPVAINVSTKSTPYCADSFYCTPSYIHTYGYFGGACLPISPVCATPLLSVPDAQGPRGYVSKITGTVQTYGSAKDVGTYCVGPGGVAPYTNNPVVCVGRVHPNSIGPGSGHGAYWCGTCYEAAAPGTVIIQYPDDYDAASTSSPNVCDCSPATPGFKTYRFLCPGSITFP